MTRLARGLALLLVAAATPLVAATPGQAAAQDNLQCRSNAIVFGVERNADMWITQHEEPETGVASWAPGNRVVGNGLAGRVIAGQDGAVNHITPAGDVFRHHWTGTTFQPPGGEKIATGWNNWAPWEQAAFRHRVTADEKGDFFAIPADNKLWWWRYEANKTWTIRVLDTDWSKFNMIFAAGEGVLYARRHDGKLYRYQYHAGSQRWLEYERFVGSGWEQFNSGTSAGGDVIYTTRPNGDVVWHRYLGGSQWAQDSGRLVGAGWPAETEMTAISDSCRLTTNVTPQRPPVALVSHNRAQLLQSADGSLHHFYVNNTGTLVHGRNPSPDASNLLYLTAIAGYQSFAGVPAAGPNEDGRLEVVAQGQDSDFRSSGQWSVNGNWADTRDAGGAMAGPAAMTRMPDGTLVVFAADGDGKLWYRQQHLKNDVFKAWHRLPLRAKAGAQVPVLSDQPMTIVSSGNQRWLVARDRDGGINVVQFDAINPPGIGSTWSNLGKTGFVGQPGAVLRLDGKIQVFARHSDGKIYTRTDDSWVELPVLADTTGSPSVVISKAGSVYVFVRTTNGRIHATKQVAPGSPAFGPWATASEQYLAATDPTGIALASGYVGFAFRSDTEETHYFVDQRSPTTQTEVEWVGGKTAPPGT